MMLPIQDRAELALSLAHATGSVELACQLVQGAARLLALYRPSSYKPYNPAAVLRRDLAHGRHVLNVEPVADAVGDTPQVLGIVRLLIDSAQLEEGAVLLVDAFQQPDRLEKEGVPCVALAFDGFGAFPSIFSFGDGMALDMEELQARWTQATRGGRIDKAPNGLLLRLKGQRATPPLTDEFEPLCEAVMEAAADCDKSRLDVARDGVEAALARVDGTTAPELADVKALVLDVVRGCRPALEARGVVCETLFASELPPVPVLRTRLRGLFTRLVAYAVQADSPGAAVTFLFEYDASRRAVVFVATVSGVEEVHGHAAFMASFQRTVDAHRGTLEVAAEKSELTLTVSLPDTVGKALDEEFTGFEVFSAQSQRILRLLKSGGPTPPPELLLHGVLEEELARWLPPQLQGPPAVNVAHELDPKQAIASPERLKKGLDQIRKGKVKRELAQPPFAAEIVYAYRATPRTRAALAAQNLSREEMEELAKGLAGPATPDALERCLRILARRLATAPK